MKFAKGGELTTILKKEGIEESKVKIYFKQIIKAIRFVHCNNVIHRDLKPTNILFLDDKKNKIVIIDFGISGIANGNNSDEDSETSNQEEEEHLKRVKQELLSSLKML